MREMTQTEPRTEDHAHDAEEDYAGPATLVCKDHELPVHVRLIAVTQPVDGRIHWFGRLNAEPKLDELLHGAAADMELVTENGRARGKVGDPDPWGRYRVSGVGRPPFELAPVPLDDMD